MELSTLTAHPLDNCLRIVRIVRIYRNVLRDFHVDRKKRPLKRFYNDTK